MVAMEPVQARRRCGGVRRGRGVGCEEWGAKNGALAAEGM